jgi:subtilisin family serine protease
LQQALEGRIPDSYIVVLKDGVGQDPEEVANEMGRQHGLSVSHAYTNALRGFAAKIPAHRLDTLRADERVDYVEEDQVVRASAQTLPWGINRIDADVSSTKAGNGKGSITNVNAYIIDTGIYKHSDLYVAKHVNFTGDGKNSDCNGHGTHVAGTVGAKDDSSGVVGAAPKVPLTGVKVLDCSGSGSYSGVIKGIDWVTANAKKPAVVNMSLGGGASQAVDDAVRKSANSGLFYALAAGNDGKDACNYSPARAGAGTNNGIMTVAATDKYDKEASFSNYGDCVDIWAPGVSIPSTKLGGGKTTMSGTSMASPHGAGGGALYLSKNTAKTPTEVESILKSTITTTSNTSKDGKAIVRENVGTM